MKQGITVYTLKDYNNDPILGYFYEGEMQKAFVNEDTFYKIESVKSRKRRGHKEVLVKWLKVKYRL